MEPSSPRGGSDILQEKQKFQAKVLRNSLFSQRCTVYIAQHTVSTRDHQKSSDTSKVGA